MKKKLAMLLALVLAFGGTSAALLTSCKPTDNSGRNEQESEYKVRFLKEDGTLIEEKTVKHGEKVEAVTAPAKEGYTAEWVDKDGNVADLEKAVTADAEYKVRYTAKTDVAYKVEYYFENVEGAYELAAAETKNLTGTTGATVTAPEVTKEHYTLNTEAEGYLASGEVKGDGSLVLKMYYKLDRVTVTFMANGETLDTKQVIYGGKTTATDKAVPAKDQTDEEEYAFKHWSATENGAPFNWNLPVEENVTLYAVYEKGVRKYNVTADFDNALYFYTTPDDGDIFALNDLAYGETVNFMVKKAQEATGTATVTAKVTNSQGTSETTLTANEDGVYTLTINGATELTVTGFSVRVYNVTLNVTDVESVYDWAKPYENLDDVKFEVTEEGKDPITADLKVEDGKVVFTWSKGTYGVRAFVEEAGAKRYISGTVTREVNSYAADDSDNITFDDEMVLSTPVDILWNQTAAVGNDGSISAENGKAYAINFTDFAPGNGDFAVTVTYDQIMDDANKRPHGSPNGDEGATSDPSLGFTFYSGKDKIEIPMFDAGAVRVWENGVRLFEHRATMAKAGALLGRLEWPDCYRHAELTYVKVGGWMYMVITADGKAGCYGDKDNWYASSAKAYTGFVPAMIDLENGIMYVRKGIPGGIETGYNRGTEYLSSTQIGKYESTFMKDVLANITSIEAELAFGAGKSFGKMTGYGYTTDAAILAELEKNLRSEFSITSNLPLADIELKVDGEDYKGEELFTIQQTRVVTFKVPAGKLIAELTIGGKDAKYDREGDMVTVVVSNEEVTGSKALVISLEEGRDAVISGTVSVEGEFTGKDQLDNVMVRFISDTGAIIRATYDKATKKYTTTVPAGTWTLFATNGYICGETSVKSALNKDATVDVKLNALASVGAVGVTSGGMTDNGDGTYSVKRTEWNSQENAMKNVTFVPQNEILELGFTITGITQRGDSAGGLYPFIGMFVKSADGGMWRIAWCNAGDQMAQMPADDLARYCVTETRNPWDPFGAPSGWYTFDKANYKLTVKVTIDGYNAKVAFKTGEETEWKYVAFDNGDTLNIYDFWNKDTSDKNMFSPINNRSAYLDTLYKLDQECQFGISVRRDGSDNDVNNVKMSDIWYNVAAKN